MENQFHCLMFSEGPSLGQRFVFKKKFELKKSKTETDKTPDECKTVPELSEYLKEKQKASVEEMQYAALEFLTDSDRGLLDGNFVADGAVLRLQHSATLPSGPYGYAPIQSGALWFRLYLKVDNSETMSFSAQYQYDSTEGRITSVTIPDNIPGVNKWQNTWRPLFEKRLKEFLGIGLKIKTKDGKERNGTVLDAFKAVKTRCITNAAAAESQKMKEKLEAEKLLKSLKDE